MSCSFEKEKLTGYYDGELETAEKAEVERHISACSECLRELGEIKSASLLVKELPRHRAPRSIAEGVSREIAAARRVHSFDRWRKGLLWATAAAAGLFLALNVVFFTGHRPEAAPVASGAAPRMATGPAHGEDREQEKAAEPAADRGPARRSLPQDEKKNAADARLAKKLDDMEEKLLEEKVEQKSRADAKPQAGGAAKPEPAKAPAREPAPAAKTAPDPAAELKQRQERGAAPAEGQQAGRPAATPAPSTAPPPAAAPKPAAPAAPPAPPEKADAFKRKEAPAEHDRQRELKDDGAVAAAWTVASADAAKARARVDETLRRLGLKAALPSDPATGVFRKGGERAGDVAVTVELTERQLAELRKELEKQAGTRVVAGRPQDAAATALRLEALSGKAAGFAAPGAADAAAAAKELEAKKLAAAEGRKAPNVDAEEAAKREKEALRSESKDKVGGEPRRKFTLHFLELPAVEKK
jgi:hypothetical protein